jgi:hypothetical protein
MVGPIKIISVKAKKLGKVGKAQHLWHIPSVIGSEIFFFRKCFTLRQSLKSKIETWETSKDGQYESKSLLLQSRDDRARK